MVIEVTMYAVKCDGCGAECNSDTEYACWNDKQYAKEDAMECGWIEHLGKDYCEDCWSYYDNDNIVVRQSNSQTEK